MPLPPGKPEGLKSTRGRIVNLLRQSGLTANEIAARLGLTHNAVRAHLAALQRQGLVCEAGWQRGVSRPAVIYEVVPEAEAIFSRPTSPAAASRLRSPVERRAPHTKRPSESPLERRRWRYSRTDKARSGSPIAKLAKHRASTRWLSAAPRYCQGTALGPG